MWGRFEYCKFQTTRLFMSSVLPIAAEPLIWKITCFPYPVIVQEIDMETFEGSNLAIITV